jgi:hypothetical protein
LFRISKHESVQNAQSKVLCRNTTSRVQAAAFSPETFDMWPLCIRGPSSKSLQNWKAVHSQPRQGDNSENIFLFVGGVARDKKGW